MPLFKPFTLSLSEHLLTWNWYYTLRRPKATPNMPNANKPNAPGAGTFVASGVVVTLVGVMPLAKTVGALSS
jgi:hypothetical protein